MKGGWMWEWGVSGCEMVLCEMREKIFSLWEKL